MQKVNKPTTMIDFIENILKTRRGTYLDDPNIIIENYRQEIEKIEEYNGRQLLEMLQNADDEAVTEKEKTCYIKLSENQLIIANNGNKFSEGGIESLMYSNLSPKLLEQNKVGQKGLGFRSILSWANKITIKSHDFAVEFSQKNANDFLTSLLKQKPEIHTQLNKKETQEKFPIAILRCPKILTQIPDNLTKYDTYIIIDLKENQTNDVQKQINNEINKEVLLFLNNLEKIIIKSPEKNFEIQKEVSNNKILIREFNDDNNKTFEKEWNIKTKSGNHKDKNYELKIAWNENLDDEIGRLYSYFKTKVKFPFPAIIHGTFELSSNRNELNNDTKGHNKFLLTELIQLLIDTALQISSNEVSYNALKLLSFYNNDSIDSFFEDNDFAENLKIKIRDNKIFPTINNKYISYKDEPVFYKHNYAEVLPKNKFENLLLFTEDVKIIQTLGWLELKSFYNKEYLFSTISEISSQLEINERAKLISYLIIDYGKTVVERNALPDIFIDQDGDIIPSKLEIFLPPSGEKISIPLVLNLKIISPELFTKLKQIFDLEKEGIIADKLKFFHVRVYEFSEIFEQIVTDFNSNPSNKTDRINSIKGLISNLYELFQSNKDKKSIDITIPSNAPIPILNKNNGETKVNTVYLGKEYDNRLCEMLFEFDKSKLVGSQKILGLEEKEYIIDFLLWLGVAKYPRKEIIKAENEYSKYAIKRFPYKEKKIYWNDAAITSFNKLKNKGFEINETKVETIIDLDSILKYNSNENILYWLHCDSRVIKTTETNPKSQIELFIRRKQSSTHIKNGDLPSYLLWKIKQTKWLETETNKKAKPIDCCISKTMTKDFAPFIEIPKIKYDNQLFKDSKIIKGNIDDFLSKVGVNKEISNFSTKTIYSMLSNLKDIDKDGEKARLIYREITENIDEKTINKQSEEYLEFIKNGYVFCSLNGSYSYEKVSDAYYIENKTFGEEIIKQFHTIEIDRRKGAKKINAIFGVKPLQDLEFSLKSIPTIHDLNEIFQKEIEELKPYFYAFRLAKDTDEKELNWIKNSKITLCTQIEPQYKHIEELKDFELKSYEFIYIKKENKVYLLVDDGQKYDSIGDFQSDYKFADSIAEIYSSILKVDTHRVSFSRLFEAKTEKKIHILKTELDDNNLEKLRTSKKKLNIVDDPKILFWFSILSSLNKKYECRKYKDEEFKKLIFANLNQNIKEYELNYEEINDSVNFPIIIQLFNNINIDIPLFNEHSTVELDIKQYLLDQLQRFKNNNEKKFEILLFDSLKNKSIQSKETFLEQQSKFEYFDQFPIKNSVKIEIDKVFYNTIESEFQIDLYLNPVDIEISGYKSNLKSLEKQIKSLNKSVLNEILENDIKLRSLIYFGEFKRTIQKYHDFIDKSDNSKKINFNNKTHKVAKGDFEALYELISSYDLITKIEKINSIKPEVIIGDGKKGNSKGNSKKFTTSDKETLGFIGEIVIFENLKKKFGDENVIWDSGFAKKANINPKGDDNKHYDIKYKNKNDKWIFVEVKTTASKNLEFKISNLEVNFGVENKNNYEIMIVINATGEKKNRSIKKLTNPFKFSKDESFTNNSKFFVKNDKFTVKLKEK